MPTRINGIGTGYYGKSNRQSFEGVCEHCHRSVILQNYETRLWFSIFYLPVIPLDRKQILSHCSSCTWHRAMPFAEWERNRQESIGQSEAKWTENQEDPDAALELHATLVAFQKQDEANALAELLLETFGNVSRVQYYFGCWYERLGRGIAAEECFAKALELDPASLPAKRAVAIGHIEKGRLDEARQLLVDFVPPKPAFEPQLFFMLAKGHQRQGEHEQALALFEMLTKAAPKISGEKDFRKAVRQSEKALGAEASLVPRDPIYRSALFKWAVAALLLAGVVGGSNLYIETHRTLHVVNGLQAPLVIQLDGDASVEINPEGRKAISVAEGSHRVVVMQPPGYAAPVDLVVRSGWFDRFFSSPIFVVDPTRSAVLAWESAVYRDRPAHAPAAFDGSRHWHVGQAFTSYPDIDLAFEEFPAQLRADKHKQAVTKTRMALLRIAPIEALAVAAAEPNRQSDLLAFAESHLRFDPADKMLLGFYPSLASQWQATDRCRNFLTTRLAERPLLVEWHRSYQETPLFQQLEDELIKEYDRYLEAEPGNSNLLYLRGRIEADDRLADDYYQRATAADPKNPYPWYAQGYRLRVAGDFSGARKALDEAARLNPADPMVAHGLAEVQFALAEFDPLEREFRSQLEKTPLHISLQQQLLEALIAAGKNDQADAAHEAYAQKAAQASGDTYQLGLQSQIHLHYLRGRFDEFRALGRQLKDPQSAAQAEFEAGLELGQVENLSAAAFAAGSQRGLQELLLGVAWSGRGDLVQASAARERAIAALAMGNRAERLAAEYLKSGPALAAGTAERLTMEPELKAVVLVALAEVCPDQKASLLTLAEKLNYRRSFPFHFLNRRIATLRGA